MAVKLDQLEAIRRFQAVHGDTYDYSKVTYKGSETKVTIVCSVHGDFEQTPSAHWKLKQGCAKCYKDRQGRSLVSNSEVFMAKARTVHGEKYDYSEVVYVRSATPVKINCQCCKESFWQSPNAHLVGKGCRGCNISGFTHNKSAYLYVLVSDELTKVGVTNKTPQNRAASVSNSACRDFTVYAEFLYDKGRHALEVENSTLRRLRECYARTDDKFNGYTECFVNVDRQELLCMLQYRYETINFPG
jgi:hypothetical protein